MFCEGLKNQYGIINGLDFCVGTYATSNIPCMKNWFDS